jgi:hypothetical protein
MRNEVIFLAAKKEEQVRLEAQIEIEHTKREEFGKNTELRHSNAELQMQLQEKNEQLVTFDTYLRWFHLWSVQQILLREKKVLNQSYMDINKHYNKLYDEARHLMYDLERKEHDVNFLKAKMQEDNGSTLLPFFFSNHAHAN